MRTSQEMETKSQSNDMESVATTTNSVERNDVLLGFLRYGLDVHTIYCITNPIYEEESILAAMHALGFSMRDVKRVVLSYLPDIIPFDLNHIVRHVISDDVDVSDFDNDSVFTNRLQHCNQFETTYNSPIHN